MPSKVLGTQNGNYFRSDVTLSVGTLVPNYSFYRNMFSAASRLIGLWGVEEQEEPPAHLIDCLDFVDSSSEDENDISDYPEERVGIKNEHVQSEEDNVCEINEPNTDVRHSPSETSPSPSPSESLVTQKLFKRGSARMYLKLVHQSPSSEC